MTALAHAPHAHTRTSVGRVMALVMAALVPATLFGFWLYGWPAIHLWVVTMGSALLFEFFALRIAERRARDFILDGSGALTAWLLALSLPPWAPWWIGVLGSFLAIVVAKQVFGGIGQNLFNPAMIARVALLISFPVEMTQWVMPAPLFSGTAPGFLDGLAITFAGLPNMDAVTSASLLGHIKTELSRGIGVDKALAGDFLTGHTLMGMRLGSLGETSSALIAMGGIVLLMLRVIEWRIPLAMIAGTLAPAALLHAVDPGRYADMGVHLLSGGLMLGAFFIATDPVTSPSTRGGQLIFGAGCGLLTYIIRTWGGYPEGVAFAVLLMNAFAPIIDRYTKPRIYGRTRDGRGIVPKASPAARKSA
jgi:Na+-translocating ferredoxin:NAD+ oxidoreductase subunit D